jgi:hypothetical protein
MVIVELPTEDVRYEPPGRDFHRYVELFDHIAQHLAVHGDQALGFIWERIEAP